MSNLNASTWISYPQKSYTTAMACVSGHIATIDDTRYIAMCDVKREGSEFKGYIVSVNKIVVT